jgi:hypothetical protein
VVSVGTAGASTMSAATNAGTTVIPVANAGGFVAGQTITIDEGANLETAVVAGTAGGGRGGNATVTLTVPLTRTHAAGVQVSGSGITVASPLVRPHVNGVPIAGSAPTPGAANRYSQKR